MLVMSALFSILFLGGWLPLIGAGAGSALWLVLKMLVYCYAVILVRAAFPRYRYDQLMSLGWKVFLPLVIVFFYLLVVLTFLY